MRTKSKSQTVEAGLLADAKDIIQSLSKTLLKGIDRLFEVGLKVEDVKEDGKGGMSYSVHTPSGEVIKVKLEATGSKDVYNIFLDHEGSKESKRNIKAKDVESFIEAFVDEECGEEVVDNVKMSNTIQAKFKRIQAANGEDIVELSAINCAMNPTNALLVVNDVLADEAIVNEIEDEASFEIQDAGDETVVTEIEECVCENNPFEEMMLHGYAVIDTLKAIHWNAKGEFFHLIHRDAEENMWDIQYELDSLAEWCVECYGYVRPSSYFYKMLDELDTTSGFDHMAGLQIMHAALEDYLSVLKLQYCNVDKSIQSVMDNWIVQIDKKVNYILERTLM